MLLTRINEEEKALEKCGVLQDALRGCPRSWSLQKRAREADAFYIFDAQQVEAQH